MSSAHVVVVGCGGLGAPVIQQLAAAGVGHLTLIDDDVVEGSNLNRQTLFTAADVGEKKAEAAAFFVERLDGSIRVDVVAERLTTANARAHVHGKSVVVDAADGLPTKYLLNDACVREDVPLVHGAATAWSGQVLVVPGAKGPCLRCLFPVLPARDTMPTCRTAGILAPTTGIIGSMQAAEAIKLLLLLPAPAGKFVAVDVKEGAHKALRFERDPACPACGDQPSITAHDDNDYFMPACEEDR